MSHNFSKNKPKLKSDRSDLLEDIQHGFRLKSSKHLSNDRSSPTVKTSGPPSNKVNNVGFPSNSGRLLNSLQVDATKLTSNGHVQNKFGTNVLRPSASSGNISSNCKPPILRPKPKVPPSVSALNISKNNSSPSAPISRITFERLSSVDGCNANARLSDASVKSGVESFATMKRSHGKKLLQQNPDICPERPRSNSFQQNRLVISSLFGNGSTSQVGSKKNSLVIQDFYDSCDNDGMSVTRSAHRGEDVIRTSSESREPPLKMIPQHHTNHASNNSHNEYMQTVKQQQVGTSHLSRSRPLPPLPAKAPPTLRYEREKVTRYHSISFEERFKFHSERDFPRPHAYAGHKKFYQSMSSKNPANHIRSVPLVTTV